MIKKFIPARCANWVLYPVFLTLWAATVSHAADPYGKAIVWSEILTGNSGNSQTDVGNALGGPDGNYVSMGGPGGSLLVDMGMDTPVLDGPGPDLEVREIGSAFGGVDEAYRVLVSNSAETNSFIEIGIGRALSLIDIQPAGLESARYIWLQDLATETLNSSTPGADIDSLRALHFSGGDDDVSPPAELSVRLTGQGTWVTWAPSPDENVTGYAIRRSLDGVSFNSAPDAVVSRRETAWHDLAVPGVRPVYYGVNALTASSESILAVASTTITVSSILTNSVVHLGDDTVADWEVPEPERQLALTFTMDGFADGPSAELTMDLWDVDNSNTPILLNGAKIGSVPGQGAETWADRTLSFAAGALQPGVNTLLIGGETGSLDDFLIRNIKLRTHGIRTGTGSGVITGARFTEIVPGDTHVTLRWVVEQTPTLSPPVWETISDPIEWTGEITSSNGFYRLREP